MSLQFGTDGVRGLANTELTPEAVVALGRAAARVFGSHGHSNVWLIGRDTRRSGTLLQAALSIGLASEGAEVIDLGVLPTPGVAYHSRINAAPAAVISASHNTFADNGVKLFSPGGLKLADSIEREITDEFDRLLRTDPEHAIGDPRPSGKDIGVLRRAARAQGDYADYLVSLFGKELPFAGLRVVVDCANGAVSAIAPQVLANLGVDVRVLSADPDGLNINEGCGSTHPETLSQAVIDTKADLGLAFDGDADRLIAVDHTGAIVDGDRVVALCARDLHARGELTNATVVVTVMSNLGFVRSMQESGINVVQTKVGDRYVLEELEANGHVLGGEQSGHVIFRNVATTGDGLLTGLMVIDILVRSRRVDQTATLHDLANSVMTNVPQLLRNVSVARRDELGDATAVWSMVKSLEAEMGDSGRVLLRPSGTEPLIRVMVEATDRVTAERAVDQLCAVLIETLGA